MNDEGRSIDRYVVRTAAQTDEEQVAISHPLAENTRMQLLPLSERVGLSRLGLSIASLAPGNQSFLPHAHTAQEEFVFVLSGTGVLVIDGEETAVSTGDFVGFPTDGSAHQLRNDGTSDLVYLMGGERTATDVVHFPTLNKKGFWTNGAMHYVDVGDLQIMEPVDFVCPKDSA
ncbi:MAG: cupin domain-containing protein [Pseudomonadota bacterium]